MDAVFAFLASRDYQFNELLVVDDGSRDGTVAVVEEYMRAHPAVRVLRNPGNRGKGYAVRHGMREAQGDWILYTDADLSSPIEEVDKLFAAARQKNAAVAIGSRALNRKLVSVHQAYLRELSGRVFNLAMRLVTGLPFVDTQCGFKLYRQDAAKAIFERQLLDGFSFDVEDLVIAKQLNLLAVEVPVRWANVEGTKVSLLAGVTSFSDLLKIRGNQIAGRYR